MTNGFHDQDSSSILNTLLNDDTNAPNPGWVFSGWWRVKYITIQKVSFHQGEYDNPGQIIRMPHSEQVLFSEQQMMPRMQGCWEGDWTCVHEL